MNASAQPTRRSNDAPGAFTLIELLVVIGIIGLLLGLAVPSIATMFRSGADAQARNVIDAQLSAARMIAVRNRRPVAVHFQRGYEIDGARDYYVAIMEGEPTTWSGVWDFRVAEGTQPVKLPGGLAAGRVDSMFGDDYSQLDYSDEGERRAFSTFSIVFGPDGKLTTMRARYPNGPLFGNGPDEEQTVWAWSDMAWMWNNMPGGWRGIYGVRALCLYNPAELAGLDDGEVQDYLNENARFLPAAPYTGGLIQSVQD